jgi:hypothetical protein
MGAVMAALHRGHGHHATYGVIVAVVMPCSAIIVVTPRVVLWSQSSHHVLWLLSPCRVWCCRCYRQAALCHGCGCHATCSVTIAVVMPAFAPHMVPQVLSLCHAWCHRCYCHSMHGVAGALLSCHAWCRRCCHRPMHGVAGTVIRLCGHGGHAMCGVMVTIVAACEVVIAVAVIVLHVVMVAVVHHV